MPLSGPGPSAVAGGRQDALARAASHLLAQQRADGSWEGEMVWNTMILSQHVIVRAIVGRPFDEATRAGILRHYQVTRTLDGAWGMHAESDGYVFFTTLAYVAQRLLGVPASDPILATARRWLHARPGGVLAVPSWGKFWLAFLGLYEYEGVNPCPPELYALPSWVPIHPTRYYCHTRNIYMGLAYLYGRRFRADLGPLREALRAELYPARYDTIDFAAHRHDVAASDLHVPPSAGVRLSADAMTLHERVHSRRFRKRALGHCFDRILFEQRSSNYQALSPVNGLLNCLAIHARDPQHPDLAPSLDGVESWRWEDAAEGVRYCGAHSTTWDTAFSLLALTESPATTRQAGAALGRAYRFLDRAQITEDLPAWREEHRDRALGGWCFSDGVHRWPVSDCTAEALCAILQLHRLRAIAPGEQIPGARLLQAAEFILLRQNGDGGFGTYERRRGSAFLEGINNTEMYGNCMTERSYVECTASSVAALSHLLLTPPVELPEELPDETLARIGSAITRGVQFLRAQQRPDGSYPGFWGINFTYAIFHVVKGLRAAGVAADDPAIARAAAWLVQKQRSDGGWGEHYTSCLDDRYVEHRESQVVMSSWALLALLEAGSEKSLAPAIERGVAWLRAVQKSDGSFPAGAQNGVFFGSAMLDYRLYKAYFPTWALARHAEWTAATGRPRH
ncbi:MAG: 2,3-oxidosqualene cyclase [Myxococcales bacterium]|nr:2,3-oxidosqualene cyclase [Myxococcales bacterium]